MNVNNNNNNSTPLPNVSTFSINTSSLKVATTNLKSLKSDKQQYLLDMLENQNIHICDNLVDIILLYHDVTNDNPYNIHKNNSGHHTKIDYIWISQNLVNDTYTSDQFNPQYSTDHMVMYVEFWTNNYFKLPSHAKQQQRNRQKTIYMYDDMSQDDWLEFFQHTKRLCEFRHLFKDEVDDIHDFNRLWDDTQRSIKEAAKTYIKSRQTTSKKDGHPLRSSLLYRNICFLQKLVIRLTNKKFLHNEFRIKLQDDWFYIKAKLFEIAGTYESEINLAANRKQIKTLCRSLMALFSIKMQEYNEEQMKNFIRKHCEDFTNNKKAMIILLLKEKFVLSF
ncbi:hypothetical protein RhiirA1_477220 [Rhizophagus irregularis]|uniref:Uncharacterized protein n=1 Tax=Rhizophagus irregularis TaxID=588596 RepID=A0A2I1FIB7_9GLOM|nr:hypothetical protein RhiirA1_477220 [Rhizophagus irregularis]PKY34089.1 hypothetical protein RhiirB3_453500 [Rhizophagus irregularis]